MPGFEFLFEKPTASKPECLAAISKLLELAHLKEVSDLGIGASITKAHQKVFIKAVTARAMDAQVIAKIDGSGVSNEWASAAIYVANENNRSECNTSRPSSRNKASGCSGTTSTASAREG
jgi:hypothetical protein